MSDPLRNEACLGAAMRAARIGLWQWDVATSRVTFSDEWKRQIGHRGGEIGETLAEWEGRVHPEDLPEVKRLLAEYFAHPESSYEAEYRMRHKDGSWRWMLARADLERDKAGKPRCFVGSHIDITEIKRVAHDRAMTERTSAEQSLRGVFRHAHTMIMKADVAMPEGWERQDALWAIKHFRWNAWFVDEAAALEVMPLELAPGETYRDGWNRAKHRDDLAAMDLTAANALISGKEGWAQEFRAIDREGRLHWFSQVASIQPAGRGRWHVTAINTDITERKRAECELARTNRALRMLTDANQALIRGTDEPALLREVCRIAVEEGGYRMAWVGVEEDDGRKIVRPAAHFGFAPGEFEAFAATRAQRAHDGGPAGVAIRTGKPCVARDLPGDPAREFWREEAVQAGCAAALALPLVGSDGRTFGVLSIHAGEAQAFDAEETRILAELAGDLAFRIGALRVRAERDQAMARQERDAQALRQVFRHARTLVMEAAATLPEGWERHDLPWIAENFTWDPRFLDETAAMEVLPLELAPGEGYHSAWARAKHPDDAAPMRLVSARAFASGAARWEQEFRATDREGRVHWFAQVASVKATGSGRWQVTTINTDVTAFKEAEQHIRQLNRIYAVLSDINQLIVRKHEPQAILEGACRIAVDRGGFPMAWIGLADATPGRLGLAAHAGATPDTVAIINDILEGRRPECSFTAQAQATGGHVLCNDLEHDPRTAAFLDEALQRGYRAMVSLPLTVAGRRAGVFNLYAGEKDFFDADELRLLDELAQDIAFALEGCERERERRDALEKLRASEERFRELAETIREVFWVATPDNERQLYISPAYEKVWGRSCQSLYEKPLSWLEAVHPDDRERVARAVALRRIEGNYEEDYRVVRPDGRVRWVRDRAFPVRNAAGQIERMVGVARDITERQEAMARIRQLAAFPELNPNPVLEFTGDGTLNYYNRAALTLSASLGLTDIGALLPRDTRAIVRACLAADKPRLRLETAHGPRTLSWSFYPIGEAHAVHCYVGEITERLKLEEQFRQSQKMEAIGQLAGGVAHDFNNLLTVIQMQASFLLGEPDKHPEAVPVISQILQASERASNLTRQLLTFSRRQAMEPRDLDLSDVVGTMTKLVRRLLGADISLETRFAPLLPMVHADPGMMEQVLMNLLVNARDAMPGGGRLTIELDAVELDAAAVAAHPPATPGRFVSLAVHDTGSGIAPENISHIFEPFFTTKELGKGTGLGLATAFGIVQQHNGWIEVTSTLGRGTRMRVLLPAISRPVAPAADATKSLVVRGGTETVLLVEDEPTVLEIAAQALRRYGYSVLEAKTAAEALRCWDEKKGAIDLLVTDVVMPGGMSGAKLAEELRVRRASLRVIFTSGYSKEAVSGELQFVTGDNFLPKPYPLKALLAIVRKRLDEA